MIYLAAVIDVAVIVCGRHTLPCGCHEHVLWTSWYRPHSKKVKSFPSQIAHRAVLICVSLALIQTPAYIARPRIYGASVSSGVPVYSPAFAGTYCAYLERDGQAELTWVAGYIIEMVYPSADGHLSKY